jgi:hypothetical protein
MRRFRPLWVLFNQHDESLLLESKTRARLREKLAGAGGRRRSWCCALCHAGLCAAVAAAPETTWLQSDLGVLDECAAAVARASLCQCGASFDNFVARARAHTHTGAPACSLTAAAR